MVFAKRVLDKNTQIARFFFCFQKPKRRKSVQNSNPKASCFEASNLKGFSRILGAFWNPKIIEKSQIFEKK